MKDASVDMWRREVRDGTRTGSLRGDTLKDIVHERVKDGHRLVRDTSIGVDLLED